MKTKKNKNGVRQPVTPIGVTFDILNSLFMILLFIVMAYPFLYVISYSFSTPAKITNPLLILPQGVTLKAYVTLFSDSEFFHSLLVSVARTILGPLSMLVVCGMGAYALSKKDLVFGKFLRMMIFFTMYFSAGVIPVYLLIKSLGLTRSFWVYILPNIASAYNVVLMRTYIESLPRELDEAVRGAAALDRLKDGDVVLISEGCTHHRQCGDIGTVKLPAWLKGYTKKALRFEFTSGGEFPDDPSPYALVVHCGGCMLNEREMKSRIARAREAGVPITNYGIAIAQAHGILRRALSPFPQLQALL